MRDITSIEVLKDEILILEAEQAVKGELLKEQFYITYEKLKPFNLLISTLENITTSPHLMNNLAGTSMGLASGYLSKKIFVGRSGNLMRKLIGSVLQIGVANFVSKHSDAIKSFGQAIIQHILNRSDINSEDRAR